MQLSLFLFGRHRRLAIGMGVNMLINFIRGFCMALADSVPGVSGGTIAFILGFYDKFIHSLDQLITGNMEKKKEALRFLIKIGIGWVVGFVAAVLFLASIFDAKIYWISSLFIGFILFSIPLVIQEEKESFVGHYKNLIFTLIGIGIVVAITYFNPVAGSGDGGRDLSNLDFGLGIYVFVVAMIAISAMVLPGISGSTLLLIFGLYTSVITAVKEVMTLNFSYLPVVIIFGCGVLVGIATVIRLIRIALDKCRSQTMYTIVGLMIGSFYAIIMGPTTLEEYQPPMTWKTFNIVFFLIGVAIIFGLQKMKSVLDSE